MRNPLDFFFDTNNGSRGLLSGQIKRTSMENIDNASLRGVFEFQWKNTRTIRRNCVKRLSREIRVAADVKRIRALNYNGLKISFVLKNLIF